MKTIGIYKITNLLDKEEKFVKNELTSLLLLI